MEQDEQEPTGIESDALNPDAAATKTQQTHGSDLPLWPAKFEKAHSMKTPKAQAKADPIQISTRQDKLVTLFKTNSLRRTGSNRPASGRTSSIRRTESTRSATSRIDPTAATGSLYHNNATHHDDDDVGSRIYMGLNRFDKLKQRLTEELPKVQNGNSSDKITTTNHAVFGPGANIKSAEEFIEREPEIECIRKEGMVKKRIVAKEIAWKEKYVSLTDDRLLLRNQPYGEIRDTIELRSVTHVRRMVESAHCAAVKGFNDSFRSDNSFKRKSSAQTSTPTFDQQASTEGPTPILRTPCSPTRIDAGEATPSSASDVSGAGYLKQDEVIPFPVSPAGIDFKDIVEETKPDEEAEAEGGGEAEEAESSDTAKAVREKSTKLKLAAKRVMRLVSVSSMFSNSKDRNELMVMKEASQNFNLSGDLDGMHKAEWKDVMEIYEECYGRTYYFRCEDENSCMEWVQAINEACIDAEATYQKSLNRSLLERMRILARETYESNYTQMAICLILVTNFIISIVQSESLMNATEDDDKRIVRTLDFAEMVFTFIYLTELLLNMFGNWFWGFFGSSWCLFDLLIVLLSVIDAVYVIAGTSGNGLAVLRLLRIFRIVRIFNKLEDMRRILSANVSAFGPVINAIILFVVTLAIYAVIAVNLFSKGEDLECTQDNGCFSSFSVAFYTLLGVATGESWTPYMHNLNSIEGRIEAPIAIFFVSFVGLVCIVAFNIIVAVLLENFVSSMNKHDTFKRIAEEAREHHKYAGALDPLLATLANFTSPQHFKSQIDLLFCLWDVDDNGTIDHEEMKNGMSKLGYDPAIQMSTDDWENFSLHGLLLDEDQELDPESFELAMRFQLADYSQRLLANKMAQSVRMEGEYAPVLFAMKMAVLEIMAAATERRQAAHDVQIQKLEQNLTSPGSWQGEGGKGGGGEGNEGAREKLSDDGLTKLTSAVAMLTSRIEDVVQAQSEIQKAQSGMQKQLSEVQACVKEQNGVAR